MKNYLFVLLLVSLIIFAPQNIFAEDYSGGFYTQYYNSADRTNTLTNTMGLGYHTGTAYTSNTDAWLTNYFYTDNLDLSNYRLGSLKIPFYVINSPPSYQDYIDTYELNNCYCNNIVNGVCNNYICNNNADTGSISNFYNANMSFNFRMYYNGGNAWTFCNLEGSNINCPIPNDATTLYNFTIFHKIIGTSAFQYKVALGRGIMIYTNSSTAIVEAQQDTTSAVNNNTSAINNVNDTLNNDSTTNAESTGNSFFSNFSTNDFGLTRIITAPIGFIQSFTRTCSSNQVVMTIYGKDVPLPCGDNIFWNREDVQAFRIIWNLMLAGPIIYGLAIKLYRTVHNALDPDKNEEAGLDL